MATHFPSPSSVQSLFINGASADPSAPCSASPLAVHLQAVSAFPNAYISHFEAALGRVSMTTALKAKVICALWVSRHRDAVDRIFAQPLTIISPADVVRALRLLDTPRLARQIRRKLAVLDGRQVRRKTVSALKNKLNALTVEFGNFEGGMTGSASVSFIRRVRQWVRRLPEERLEFYLINFATDPWRSLIDMVHTKPSDFQLPYFQSVVFGHPAPATSLVSAIAQLSTDSLERLLEEHPRLFSCYSTLRAKIDPNNISARAKQLIASHAPLEDVLWFYEELSSGHRVDQAIARRLESGEELGNQRGRVNYGKLMERMLRGVCTKISSGISSRTFAVPSWATLVGRWVWRSRRLQSSGRCWHCASMQTCAFSTVIGSQRPYPQGMAAPQEAHRLVPRSPCWWPPRSEQKAVHLRQRR